MRRTKKTKKTRMQGHMAVAISMAMAAGLALTGCGSTGTTGVSAETSAGGKNEAGRNTAGNTAGGQEESQSGAGAAQVTDTKKGGKDGGTSLIFTGYILWIWRRACRKDRGIDQHFGDGDHIGRFAGKYRGAGCT